MHCRTIDQSSKNFFLQGALILSSLNRAYPPVHPPPRRPLPHKQCRRWCPPPGPLISQLTTLYLLHVYAM